MSLVIAIFLTSLSCKWHSIWSSLHRSQASFSILLHEKQSLCFYQVQHSFHTGWIVPQGSGGCVIQYTTEMATRFHLPSSEHFCASGGFQLLPPKSRNSFPSFEPGWLVICFARQNALGVESVPVLSPGTQETFHASTFCLGTPLPLCRQAQSSLLDHIRHMTW